MRKNIVLTSLFLTILALVGCSNKNNLPVIHIEQSDLTIDLNEPFDFMTGVSAIDFKKKDLTSAIEVDEGGFNNLYEGEFQINYSVTDKNGKVGTAIRTIRVVDKLRAANAPILSNPNDVVVEYKELKLTNQHLYTKLKELVGIQTLVEIIDYDLFKDYSIDQEKYDDYFNGLFNYYGEQEFIKLLSRIGYYKQEDETDEAFYARVKTYLSLYFLKVEAVKDATLNELTADEIQNAIDSYREDVCVINLVFNTRNEASSALTEINNYTGDQVDYFKSKYVSGNKPATSDSYLSQQMSCDYDRIIYNNQTSISYRDKVFNLNSGEYTTEPIVNNSRYYLTYVIGKANPKEQYDNDLFQNDIKNYLVNKKLTNDYIYTKVNSIRLQKGLKIYDPLLASQYKEIDGNFTGVSELTDPSIIASYNGVNLTTDAYYETIKNRYAAPELLDKLNYEALNEIEGIKLSEDDLNQIKSQLTSIKTQYEYYYSSTLKYTDFLIDNFGVLNENELSELLKINILSTRYLLGYNDYVGQTPITQTDLENAYSDYYHVRASHILIAVDADTTKEEAFIKANQLIYGVGQNETAYITYNGQPFVGLEHLTPDQISSMFGSLAATYSDDTGSKSKNGDLGYYTPGKMVKPFDDATRILAKQGVGYFSQAPVETEFGYHVILITDDKKPIKPLNYDSLTKTQLEDIVKNKSDQAVVNYYNIIQEIKSNLETERLTYDHIEYNLVSLRSNLQLTIHDQDVLNHYQKLNEIALK